MGASASIFPIPILKSGCSVPARRIFPEKSRARADNSGKRTTRLLNIFKNNPVLPPEIPATFFKFLRGAE
jgi:hypothetical protein